MNHSTIFASFAGAVALVATTGCASLQSVSVTAVPAERTRAVHADASNTAFLGIHFSNSFADGLRDRLREQCPHGKVTGIFTKYETYWVVLVETRTVTATGYCVNGTDTRAASKEASRPVAGTVAKDGSS